MSGVARTNRPGGTGQATRQQLDELDALLQRMLDLPVSKAEPEPAEQDYAPPRPASPRPEPPRPPAPRPAPGPRRAYPPSYMVVETSAPPLRPAHDEPTGEAGLGPRRVERPAEAPEEGFVGYGEQLPADQPEEDWVPLRSTWQPSEQTWKPLAETWQQARGSTPPVIPPQPSQPWSPPPTPTVPAAPRPASPHTAGQPVIPPPPSPGRPEPPTSALLLPAVWFNKAFDVFLVPLGPPGRWLQGRAGRGFLGTLGLLALAGAFALAVADGCGWTR